MTDKPHQMDPFECLRVSLKDASAKCETADSQHRCLKDKYEKLEVLSKKTSEECKTLRETLTTANEALKTKNEELQKQLNTSNKQNEELQKQLTDFKERNKELQKEIEDSGSSLNEVVNEKAAVEVFLAEAKKKLKLVLEQKSNLESKLKEQKTRNAKLAKQIKNNYKKFTEEFYSNLDSNVKCLENSGDEEELTCLQTNQLPAVEIASTGDGKGSNRSSPVSTINVQTRSNQANTVVSPRRNKDNSNILRSPISYSTIPAKSNNTMKLVSVSTEGIAGGVRNCSSPSVDSPPNKPSQIRSILSPRSDNQSDRCSPISSNLVASGVLAGKEETIRPTTPVPSITVTSDNQSKAKPVSTDEKNRLAVASIIGVQSQQANTSVIPTADGLNLRRSPVSPAPTTSRNRSPIKSVSTDSSSEKTNRPVPTSIFGVQSNQPITPVSPTAGSHNLLRSLTSPVHVLPGKPSTAKPLSIDAKEGSRRPSTVLVSAQSNESVIGTTPSKYSRTPHPSPGSPSFSFSQRTPSKVSTSSASLGNKEQDIHSSRSSLLVSRAQENQREANDASRGDNQTGSQSGSLTEKKTLPITAEQSSPTEKKTSPITAEQTSNSRILPPTPEKEVATPSNTDKDSTTETSRPEDMMPLLFPNLRNTPRRSLTNSDGSDSRNVSILDDENESNSRSPSVQSVRSSSPSSDAQWGSNIRKFPIVSLSRIEVSGTYKQTLSSPEISRKNRKASQEDDVAGPSKKRKSYTEQMSTRRKSIANETSATSSQDMRASRWLRQVTQKVYSDFV